MIRTKSTKKIDYAVAAARLFVHYLHRDQFDCGMLATFGDTFRVDQKFTTQSFQLQYTLDSIQNTTGGTTRLYDSIKDTIDLFWANADTGYPWLLTIITDGQDNASTQYRCGPSQLGRYVARNFMHETDNFIFLIAVGEDNVVNYDAILELSTTGGFPAITIDNFSFIESVFLNIALQVSESLLGTRTSFGNVSWDTISSIYQVTEVPMDYAFLIDRSGSMREPG